MPGIDQKKALHVLCLLTLKSDPNPSAIGYVAELDDAGRAELLALADAHHVVIRALQQIVQESGDVDLSLWASAAIADEQERIARALPILSDICRELEAAGCPAGVMKSLDHWPDLGNDLDLLTTGDQQQVVEVMTRAFRAMIEARSWGDRLANKWNFRVPGLRESTEIHVGRLGQTGEHKALARRFISRRVPREVGGYRFLVTAPEERIIEATLQRVYRHFYFRVCDILDTATLADSGALDYGELQLASEQAGIWPGVATYLRVVSEWIERYRGTPLALPGHVLSAARFGGDTIYAKRKFLRVPILPQGAQLYASQLMRTAARGELAATLRLSLLPPLASAAALAFRLTGSDKGVW